MTLSLGVRAVMLDGLGDYMATGSGQAAFTIYQTNTSLAVFPIDTVPFHPANLDSIVATDPPVNSTGTEVAGTANRFVMTNRDGGVALSGSIGAIGSGADIELPSLTVTAAATQTLNSLVFRMDAYGNISTEASLTLQ